MASTVRAPTRRPCSSQSQSAISVAGQPSAARSVTSESISKGIVTRRPGCRVATFPDDCRSACRRSIVARAARPTAAFPLSVRGPVDSPPCMRHRPLRAVSAPRCQTGVAWQAWPSRHLAPQRRRSLFGFRRIAASSSARALMAIFQALLCWVRNDDRRAGKLALSNSTSPRIAPARAGDGVSTTPVLLLARARRGRRTRGARPPRCGSREARA